VKGGCFNAAQNLTRSRGRSCECHHVIEGYVFSQYYWLIFLRSCSGTGNPMSSLARPQVFVFWGVLHWNKRPQMRAPLRQCLKRHEKSVVLKLLHFALYALLLLYRRRSSSARRSRKVTLNMHDVAAMVWSHQVERKPGWAVGPFPPQLLQEGALSLCRKHVLLLKQIIRLRSVLDRTVKTGPV